VWQAFVGAAVFLYNLLNLKRTTWSGPELSAGKHTIVFDFKSDWSGPGKGRNRRALCWTARKWPGIPWSTPCRHVPGDESFDIGRTLAQGSRLLEYRYDSSVQFTGKINKADVQARTGA